MYSLHRCLLLQAIVAISAICVSDLFSIETKRMSIFVFFEGLRKFNSYMSIIALIWQCKRESTSLTEVSLGWLFQLHM